MVSGLRKLAARLQGTFSVIFRDKSHMALALRRLMVVLDHACFVDSGSMGTSDMEIESRLTLFRSN